MNIETLKADIEVYYDEVLNNGFARDVQDYQTSIDSQSSNILALRDVAGKVLNALNDIVNGDLPESLSRMLPAGKYKPFTGAEFESELSELIDDKIISQDQFFSELQNILQRLNQSISSNQARVFEIEKFIKPFLETIVEKEIYEDEAHASIVFKDIDSTTSLKHFSRILHLWNRTLPMYYGLLKSDSAKDVEIVTVQNGSIDLLVNLNIDFAINLAEVMEIGFKVLGAYLSYKKLILPITQSYRGNEKLVASEDQREKDLLENVGLAMKSAISKQHTEARKKNKEIRANQTKVVAEVAKLLAAHVIKGNDFKLLTFVDEELEGVDVEEVQESKMKVLSNNLNSASRDTRAMLKSLPEEEKTKLLEHYADPKDPKGDD